MNERMKKQIRALDAAANRLHRQAMANDIDARNVFRDVLREVRKADSLAREIIQMPHGQRPNYSKSTIAGLSSVQTNIYKLISSVTSIGGEARYIPSMMGQLFYDIRDLVSAMKRNDENAAIAEAKSAIASVARIVKSVLKSISTV